MFDETFLDKLKNKYNYDNKTIKALSLVIPSVINYYGEEYEETILNSIFNCEIIPCKKNETIQGILNKRKLTSFTGSSFCIDIDRKRAESVYIPNIKIIYNEENNTYEIKKIDRIIVTSHTFNYDSLKGLEILTHVICHLVKSYKNEIVIDENIVTIRSGLSYEKRKIINDGSNIFLELIEDYGKALEEGFNLYDSEVIVSSIYSDKYKCYDYDSVYTVATILKEKYHLQNEINEYEIEGDIEGFKKKYNADIINKLSSLCDNCLVMENEMFLSYTRDDKNVLASMINKTLSGDVYDSLISIYQSKNNIRN